MSKAGKWLEIGHDGKLCCALVALSCLQVQVLSKGLAVEVEFLQVFSCTHLGVDDPPFFLNKCLYLPEEKYLCLKCKATQALRSSDWALLVSDGVAEQ